MNLSHPVHHRHWRPAHRLTFDRLLGCTEQATFADLGRLGVSIIGEHGGPLQMISGPMTTGGNGSVEENLRAFACTIECLTDTEGHDMFSQMPFIALLAPLYHISCRTSRALSARAGSTISVNISVLSEGCSSF